MRSFQHVSPPLRVFHGPDSLQSLGSELDRVKSRHAVIFCGSSLARKGTQIDLIRAAMGERCAGVFAGVRAHSPLPAVEEAAQALQRLQADAVIAVGGGSAIVTARAASILVAEANGARNLCTTRDENGQLRSPKLLAPKMPQLVIPTTPTTAAVKAGSAVFDTVDKKRLALFDPKTRAQAVFIHPGLLKSAPRELIASAALNTYAMAVEGLLSRAGQPLADALLMHALRLLARHLPNPAFHEDAGALGEIMLAAVLCGQGTDYTGGGITLVLGHAISAGYHVDNGVANALVLPHALRFNGDAAVEGLAKVAASLGLPSSTNADAVIEAVASVWRELGIPRRLRDAGVPREKLSDIAASVIDDWFLRGNSRPVRDVSELRQILEEAW